MPTVLTLGFTGTRRATTPHQRDNFRALLAELNPTEFHHGCCVGADAEAAVIVRATCPSCRIIAHPGRSAAGGDNDLLDQAALAGADEIRDTRAFLARNRDIVHACDVLVAMPFQDGRPARGTGGGTWYTVEYAESKGKPVLLLMPRGQVRRIGSV